MSAQGPEQRSLTDARVYVPAYAGAFSAAGAADNPDTQTDRTALTQNKQMGSHISATCHLIYPRDTFTQRAGLPVGPGGWDAAGGLSRGGKGTGRLCSTAQGGQLCPGRVPGRPAAVSAQLGRKAPEGKLSGASRALSHLRPD